MSTLANETFAHVILAHVTGFETSTILAAFALGVAVGVMGMYIARFLPQTRRR